MGELIFQEEPLLLADSDAVPSETIEILDGICRLVVLQHAISRDPSGNESEDGASSVSTTLLLALLAFVKSSQFTQESVLTRFFIPEKESVAAGFLEALHQAVKHMCERSLISLPELAPLAAKLDFNGPMEVLDAVAMIAHCNIFAVLPQLPSDVSPLHLHQRPSLFLFSSPSQHAYVQPPTFHFDALSS